MERKRLSLKSRRRVWQGLDKQGREKRTKQEAERPGGHCRGCSPQLQLKWGVAGLLGGKGECLERKRSWDVQVPALLSWPSLLWGVRDIQGCPCVASVLLWVMLQYGCFIIMLSVIITKLNGCRSWFSFPSKKYPIVALLFHSSFLFLWYELGNTLERTTAFSF